MMNSVTDAQLDAMVSEARARSEEAWRIQSLTTPAEGYSYSETNAATAAAMRADSYFHNLCDEREDRSTARTELKHILEETHAVAINYSLTGPWTVGFFGNQKCKRAAIVSEVLERNHMPHTIGGYAEGVSITFSRKPFDFHIPSVTKNVLNNETSPNTPPADQPLEVEFENVYTPALAVYS